MWKVARSSRLLQWSSVDLIGFGVHVQGRPDVFRVLSPTLQSARDRRVLLRVSCVLAQLQLRAERTAPSRLRQTKPGDVDFDWYQLMLRIRFSACLMDVGLLPLPALLLLRMR